MNFNDNIKSYLFDSICAFNQIKTGGFDLIGKNYAQRTSQVVLVKLKDFT